MASLDLIADKMPGFAAEFTTMARRLERSTWLNEIGQVTSVRADMLETALDSVAVAEICDIEPAGGGPSLPAQVVSAEKGRAMLVPLQPVDGLTVGAIVRPRGESYSVRVGEALIGRTLDGLGQPIDGLDLDQSGLVARPVAPRGANPMARAAIDKVLPTGVRAVDGFLTVGRGQRMAVLGEPGAGKSTLLGMLAAGTEADVVVIAMVGERGREVREFVERQLPAAVRKKCIVVAATSDRPALERINGGHVAAAIAEYFRDQGKDVLLLFDSVTRFARALREVGLAAGEEAVRGGFTPSVYAELPRLIERSGRLNGGSITAFYTVLMENNGVNDPLTEEVMSLTDGHIVLDAEMAQRGAYPAIDILRSKSRLMNEIVPREQWMSASLMRGLMAKYKDIELLLQVGEYAAGHDREADRAIASRPVLNGFLGQSVGEPSGYTETAYNLSEIASAYGGN